MGFGGIALIFVVLLLAAGATVAIFKRYSLGWPCWQSRDAWSICLEDWRRKLAWLWAPREEKVGLVKAQHPTPQAVQPGLYRQSSATSSQYVIMHSDSDLRLDAAQGVFTRFEAVDRDLHPPSEALSSQSQRNAASRGESPPPASSAPASVQLDDIPPQPLRPAPQPRPTARPRPSPLRADYLRQIRAECEPSPLTPPPPPPPPPALASRAGKYPRASSAVFLFQEAAPPPPPPIPPPPAVSRTLSRENFDAGLLFDARVNPFGEARKLRYGGKGHTLSEPLFDSKDMDLVNDASPPYGSYDIIHESRNNFDSIFGTQLHQESAGFLRRASSNRNLQDLERISRYIQSLPDAPARAPSPTAGLYEGDDEDEGDDEVEGGAASPAAPPPPAPPDPGKGAGSKPTTGEKIFQALRAVTSQSYIDASEFYNSILTSAQQVQSMAFSPASILDGGGGGGGGLDGSRQDSRSVLSFGLEEVPSHGSSDLFSAELNHEANRTAQQVCDSLQDPPASALLLKDVDQQTYSYLSTDPSFTRTSEDIFNSLEHRRNSVQERLNGFQDAAFELEGSSEDAQQLRLHHQQQQQQQQQWLARRSSQQQQQQQEVLSALEEAALKRRLSQLFDEIAGEEDEQILAANGSVSRRGSLDDFACLQRAISCESVCSDTSVVLNDLETGAEEAPVVGLVCVGLEHDRWPCYIGETDLIVSVLEARDLLAGDGRPAQNTFARVCLLPDRQTQGQTRLYKSTNCPSYQEKFYFPLDGGPVGRTLLVEVYSHDLTSGESNMVGEASLRLGPVPRPPATTWLPLISPAQPVPQHGELMFSLSYLPTAERLTLVVVKARNLKGADEIPGDLFVKVYLLQQGKKMHKKRTTIKRGEKSPIFNEAIIFNVPAHSLQNVQLRLTVAEVGNGEPGSGQVGKAYPVGHVIVGGSTSGRSLTHWRQMLNSLRRPVAMWHPLRK